MATARAEHCNLNKEKNTFLNSSKFYQINESKLSKKLTVSLLKKQKIISLEVFKFQEKENCLGISFSWDKDKSYFISLEKSDSEIYNEIKTNPTLRRSDRIREKTER